MCVCAPDPVVFLLLLTGGYCMVRCSADLRLLLSRLSKGKKCSRGRISTDERVSFTYFLLLILALVLVVAVVAPCGVPRCFL